MFRRVPVSIYKEVKNVVRAKLHHSIDDISILGIVAPSNTRPFLPAKQFPLQSATPVSNIEDLIGKENDGSALLKVGYLPQVLSLRESKGTPSSRPPDGSSATCPRPRAAP